MSINKNYLMAGMLATALVSPLIDSTVSYADDTRITTARVNFRSGPSTSYSSMGIIEKGEVVTYLGTSGEWIKVKYNSKTGYIYRDYISTITSSSTSTKYVNTSAGLNVRSGPSTSYAKVAKLAYGTQVTVTSESNGWAKIKSGSTTGYVSSAYLSSTKPSSGTTSNDSSNSTTSTTKYVNTSVGLNVRSGPSTSYAKVAKLAYGTQVTVTSESNGWAKITSGSTTGYVSSSYLSSTKPSSGTNSDDSSNSTTSTTKYVNTSAGLNVRSGPSTSYAKVAKLAYGTQVTVTSESNGWAKIKSGSTTGYVSSSYLSSTKPSSGTNSNDTSTSTSASKVVAYAKQFLGKPYVWGAQGPNSFDCSGLMYYVFKNSVGITLPRTSVLQSQYGTAVSKSNLKAGDLVFFDTVGANNGGVTHCGMYIGDGQFIHAASGQGKVVINNLSSSYYVNAYVNARRVL